MKQSELKRGSGESPRSVGKRVGGAVYVHISAINWLPKDHIQLIEDACTAADVVLTDPYNVVKIDIQQQKVSLLHYGKFKEDPFPALMASYTVNLGTGRARKLNYSRSANPPILHRKELLLPPDSPNISHFSKLTSDLEKLGLYQNNRQIGFRQQWANRLSDAGVYVRNHRVIEAASAPNRDHPWSA